MPSSSLTLVRLPRRDSRCGSRSLELKCITLLVDGPRGSNS
jgi:hypothetical protein